MPYGVRSPFFRKEQPKPINKAVVGVATINGIKQWANVSNELQALLSQSFNFTGVRLNLKTVEGQTEAFGRCAPVAAIIGRLAEYSQNVRVCFEDAKGKEVLPKSALVNLVIKPNPFQTFQEFVASATAFIKLHGQCYILPVAPFGFAPTSAGSIYVVPNFMVTPNYTGKHFLQDSVTGVIKSYRIAGFNTDIPADQMIVVRDSVPSVINDTTKIFDGMSRLYSLGDQVNNIIAIQDALYNMTTRRGALGAWVPELQKDIAGTIAADPKEVAEVVEMFQRYGANQTNLAPFMVLKTAMKWVQAAMNVKDLMLFEGNDSAIQQIASSYNFPLPLIGLKDANTTYNNLDTARKDVYTGSTIPCVTNILNNLAAFFRIGPGITLCGYFDHLDIFQKSKKDEADAFTSMTGGLVNAFSGGLVTREEGRTLLANFIPSGATFDPLKPLGEFNDLQNG